MGAIPRISVVIPSRGAPSSLARTLHCLALQTLPPSEFEVLVAVGVPVQEAQKNIPAGLPYALRVVSQPGPGPARRRNAGAAAARAELLLFLDDDMAPEPQLLAAHCEAQVGGRGRRVVMGYLPPSQDVVSKDGGVDWFKAQLRDWWEDVFIEMARPGHRFSYTDVLSGNFSLPAALFQSVGGFDITFTCREDYELGVRLLAAGAELAYSADARSWHEDRTDYPKILQRKRDEGKADVMTARRYPELRSTLNLSRQLSGLFWPSRLLRSLTRLWPAATDRLVVLLLPLLGLFEWLRIRFLWRIVLGGLLVYSYWRGVLAEATGWDEVRLLAQPPPAPPPATVDLAQGLESAALELGRRQAPGVRFTWRNLPLGSIPYEAGAEAAGRRHMQAWLDDQGALPLRRAQALGDLLAIEREVEWGEVAYVDPQVQLPPEMVTEIDLAEGRAALTPLLVSVRQWVCVRLGDYPLGWLCLEAQRTPRSEAQVLYALLLQLDDILLLAPRGGAAPHSPSLNL